MAKTQPVGAHIDADDPLRAAKELGADCVQIFQSKPSGWEKPPQREDAAELIASPVGLYVHAPYRINVCNPRPNVRYGARKMLQDQVTAAKKIGAIAVIVHPGHAEDGIEVGVGRWTRTLEMLESEVPLFLENTAGGDNAVARKAEALAQLWEAVQAADPSYDVGFCFDTCHAHAAGEDLSDVVERMRAITGRIDLVHANDSRDPPGTGADRHANIGDGTMDLDQMRHMIRAGKAPVIVETPRDADALRADMDFVRKALG